MKSLVSHDDRIDAGSSSFYRRLENGIFGGLPKPCGNGGRLCYVLCSGPARIGSGNRGRSAGTMMRVPVTSFGLHFLPAQPARVSRIRISQGACTAATQSWMDA